MSRAKTFPTSPPNLLEDARIGIAPLEKSTRYVRFDQKDGAGNYFILPRSQDHGVTPSRRLYRSDESAVRDLFPADGADVRSVATRCPSSSWKCAIRPAAKRCRTPMPSTMIGLRRWAETAYRATVRAQACDVLAQLSAGGDADQRRHVRRRPGFRVSVQQVLFARVERSEGARPARCTASSNQLIPSFVKRAQLNEYLVGITAAAKALAAQYTSTCSAAAKEPVDADRL